MFPEIDRELIGADEIAARVGELANLIARDVREDLAQEGGDATDGGRVVLVPIMSGALVFTADLIRRLPLKLSLELLAVSSYPGKSLKTRGAALASELTADLSGKHVIIIDDILDSGGTLKLVRELLGARRPATLRAAVLLEKTGIARVKAPPGGVFAEYVGFRIPDEFVVGYGLDFDGHYRNLPAIATLRPTGAR